MTVLPKSSFANLRRVPNGLRLDAIALHRQLGRFGVRAVAVELLSNTVGQVWKTSVPAYTCPGYVRHDTGRHAVFPKAIDG